MKEREARIKEIKELRKRNKEKQEQKKNSQHTRSSHALKAARGNTSTDDMNSLDSSPLVNQLQQTERSISSNLDSTCAWWERPQRKQLSNTQKKKPTKQTERQPCDRPTGRAAARRPAATPVSQTHTDLIAHSQADKVARKYPEEEAAIRNQRRGSDDLFDSKSLSPVGRIMSAQKT